jgi:hypothetical protein
MVRLAGSFPEFASTDMKPPMFRKKEFESIVAAGIIKPEEHAQLVDGFIFVQLPRQVEWLQGEQCNGTW